jgi:SAM-dependent methyltransferase
MTLTARDGYGEWAATYDATVAEELDGPLLDRLDLELQGARVADLGCGTGRTGAWLRARGAVQVDGVDVTPEMLDRARRRGAHDRLVVADVADTGLAAGGYDLAVCALVDEHLADLRPLYAEAARLAPAFVLVGVHPAFFQVTGLVTHFHRADGEEVQIATHLHQLSEQVAAARAAGLWLDALQERVVDDAFVAAKPKWERWRGLPVSFAARWVRAA